MFHNLNVIPALCAFLPEFIESPDKLFESEEEFEILNVWWGVCSLPLLHAAQVPQINTKHTLTIRKKTQHQTWARAVVNRREKKKQAKDPVATLCDVSPHSEACVFNYGNKQRTCQVAWTFSYCMMEWWRLLWGWYLYNLNTLYLLTAGDGWYAGVFYSVLIKKQKQTLLVKKSASLFDIFMFLTGKGDISFPY